MDTLFSMLPFSDYVDTLKQSIISEVNSVSSFENDLEKEAEGIAEDFILSPLKLDISKCEGNVVMKNDVAVVIYNITTAYKKEELLKCRPSKNFNSPVPILYRKAMLSLVMKFEVPTKFVDVELTDEVIKEVKSIKDEVLLSIALNEGNLNVDVMEYNRMVYPFILDLLTARKKKVEKIASIKSKL